DVVGQLAVDQMIDRDGARAEEKRVAVGGGARHRLDADDVACAAAIFDVELLAQRLAQMASQHARQGIGVSAGRGWYEDFHRAVGIALSTGVRHHQPGGERTREQGPYHRRPPCFAYSGWM